MDERIQKIEGTGSNYTLQGMLEARRKTWAAMEEIRNSIQPGMLESDASKLADETLAKWGATQRWHRSWVRFGKNTLLPYGTLSEAGTRLAENDIFFMDLGPVFDGFEGDCGSAYTVGSDPEMKRCAEDAKEIHLAVAEKWKKEGWTGQKLYDFAEGLANSKGWVMTLKNASGHRLGDFPHMIHHKGPFSELDFTPGNALWVLEIQLRHPERPFGAFYEDLLVK